MKIEELADFINLIDQLSDRDFQSIHNIIHLRAMRRAQARYPKPLHKPKKGGKDCEPIRGY